MADFSFDKLLTDQFDSIKNEIKELRTEMRISILNLKHQDRLSFNLKEAAQITGYTPETLYNYTRQGLIHVTQAGPGSHIVVTKEDLIDFIVSHNSNFNFKKSPQKSRR